MEHYVPLLFSVPFETRQETKSSSLVRKISKLLSTAVWHWHCRILEGSRFYVNILCKRCPLVMNNLCDHSRCKWGGYFCRSKSNKHQQSWHFGFHFILWYHRKAGLDEGRWNQTEVTLEENLSLGLNFLLLAIHTIYSFWTAWRSAGL